MDPTSRELMTTAEVAALLRVKERKVYDLVAAEAIPCTRVTGKLLFPRELIELWVTAGTRGGGAEFLAARPPVAAGSHDPLLDWSLRESGCGIATLFDGSLDGVTRFARGEALIAGMHVPDPDTDDPEVGHPNRALVAPLSTAAGGLVLIEWARRTQGLILPTGNPKAIAGLHDLIVADRKIQLRQPNAGSYVLLERLMARDGLSMDQLMATETPARDETAAAQAVLDGRADAAFGIEAAARRVGLDFLRLAQERYDLAITRRDYFNEPFQKLIKFSSTPALSQEAERLGGYDITGLGSVSYNG